jgi:hypothetical protein
MTEFMDDKISYLMLIESLIASSTLSFEIDVLLLDF